MLDQITSGGATVNDAYSHGSIPTLAFGGVGDSGHGSYRGKATFDTFTHRRSVVTTPGWMERFLSVRYPPYDNKLTTFRMISKWKPNFDREGNENTFVKSLTETILRISGKNKIGAIIRLTLVALIAFKAITYSERMKWRLGRLVFWRNMAGIKFPVLSDQRRDLK